MWDVQPAKSLPKATLKDIEKLNAKMGGGGSKGKEKPKKKEKVSTPAAPKPKKETPTEEKSSYRVKIECKECAHTVGVDFKTEELFIKYQAGRTINYDDLKAIGVKEHLLEFINLNLCKKCIAEASRF